MLRVLLLLAIAAPLQAQPPASFKASTAAVVSEQAAGRPISLEEAYALALKRSEELAQRAGSVAEAWARVDEMWSAVKPAFTLRGTEFAQDTSASGGVVSNSPRRDKPEAKVMLHQPLFSGLRDFLAVRVARAGGRSAELDLRRAEDLLYSDVAVAFLDQLGMDKEIAVRRSIVAITADRVRELKERERIGRTRHSEVLAAESQLAQNEADLKQALRRERDVQLKLRFLTGLEDELAPLEVPLKDALGLEDYLARARTRADVEARRLDAGAARENTTIAGRARWPLISFDGNYYLKRIGTLSDARWDLLVTGDLPLYQGGKIGAQVRQAEARARRADEVLGLALRKAELETRTAHEELVTDLAAVAALEKASELAEANAKAQAEDYRLGVVTNLDVLGALNALQQVRLRLDGARLDTRLARIQLDVASGGVPRP